VLGAGLVDELQLAVMPVVFGGGLRLLENLEVREIGARTNLGFRVLNR